MNHYLLNNLEFNNIHFYENTISVMVKKTKIILTKSDDGCCDIRIHLRDKRGLDEGKFKFYIFKNANNNSCKYTFSESFKYRNDENEPNIINLSDKQFFNLFGFNIQSLYNKILSKIENQKELKTDNNTEYVKVKEYTQNEINKNTEKLVEYGLKKLIELDFLSVYDNYTIHNDYKDKDSICLNFNGFVFLLNKYNELTSMYYNYEYYHYILNLNKQNIEVVFIYNHDTYPEYKIYFNSENELKNKLEKIN